MHSFYIAALTLYFFISAVRHLRLAELRTSDKDVGSLWGGKLVALENLSWMDKTSNDKVTREDSYTICTHFSRQ